MSYYSSPYENYFDEDECYDLEAGFAQAEVRTVKKKINVKSSSLKNKLAACDRRIATMQRAIDQLMSERERIDIENAEWFGKKVVHMDDSYLCNALRWAGRKFNTVQIRDHDYEKPYAIAGPGQLYGVYDIMFDEAVKRGLRF